MYWREFNFSKFHWSAICCVIEHLRLCTLCYFRTSKDPVVHELGATHLFVIRVLFNMRIAPFCIEQPEFIYPTRHDSDTAIRHDTTRVSCFWPLINEMGRTKL